MTAKVSPLTKIATAVRDVVADALGASETRVLGIKRQEDGWLVDIEALVRDPQRSISNAAGSKDVFHRARYRCEFDADLEVQSMSMTEED